MNQSPIVDLIKFQVEHMSKHKKFNQAFKELSKKYSGNFLRFKKLYGIKREERDFLDFLSDLEKHGLITLKEDYDQIIEERVAKIIDEEIFKVRLEEQAKCNDSLIARDIENNKRIKIKEKEIKKKEADLRKRFAEEVYEKMNGKKTSIDKIIGTAKEVVFDQLSSLGFSVLAIKKIQDEMDREIEKCF